MSKGWTVRRQDLREKIEKKGRPSYNEFDGLDKWWTKQCEGCPSHWIIDEDDVCIKGIAWKILYKQYADGVIHKPRKCTLIKVE